MLKSKGQKHGMKIFDYLVFDIKVIGQFRCISICPWLHFEKMKLSAGLYFKFHSRIFSETYISRFNSGNFRTFEVSEWNLNLNSSDCRAESYQLLKIKNSSQKKVMAILAPGIQPIYQAFSRVVKRLIKTLSVIIFYRQFWIGPFDS